MTLAEAEEMLTGPGATFETEDVEIRGHMTRVWKNIPPTFPAFARALVEAFGDNEFIVFDEERITYRDWYRAATALAHKLHEMGVEKGDRVALAAQNLPEWPVVYYAVLSLGGIVVPLNAWWTGQELEYGLTDSGAKILIADGRRYDRIKPLLPEIDGIQQVIVTRPSGPLDKGVIGLDALIGPSSGWGTLPHDDFPAADIGPEDDGTILYTSGTTGHPKGAVATHRNSLTNLLSSGYATARGALRRGETPEPASPLTILLVIPMFHVTGCTAIMGPAMASGSKVVLMRKWDATGALELIEREKVTMTGGVPTIAWQILEHPDRAKYDLSSLESITYGGAPAAPELVRKIKSEFGASPGSGWGMTETSGTVTGHTAEDYLHRADSCGPPVPVAKLKIMSEDGTRELPTGEIGELWAFGAMVVRGYWNKPEANAESFIDGWIRTGDLARLDEEGFCYICDRAKDMIIRGGENIYSSEVENVLYDHPAVTDAALIGLPHKTLGEEPAAVVHLAPGKTASEEELKSWVSERLAKFKTPVRIVFVDDTLPRNANGKIMKKDLADLFFAEAETAA
ncbi:class I adenylate-forming enzyme family protein [Parasphingopyxis marina]|uniref:3-methylmercaptopropionyl-CoA ligase n=1 Tax=Parasphingopyxis marina TaxID=2761622 RepID=A0A842HUQ3_9SPHN|nr:class I adenylate-forming enzyme family protein [Parasphingopyxis marina]MBC2776796.1 acyl--CoA ligase [Parasphingopyxis marina]